MHALPSLVTRLLREQHPHLADLEVVPVERQGHDNRTFRLGSDLVVRLPSAPAYADAVLKEHDHLPTFVRDLSVATPEPVAHGEPSETFPLPWSVRRWVPGDVVDERTRPGLDLVRLGTDLAAFLAELHHVETLDGPPPGDHSFWRGDHVGSCGKDFVRSSDALVGRYPAGDRLFFVHLFEAAVTTRWEGPDFWVHGDVAAGNLLTTDGRLSGVIDFGCCAVGDPACDLVVAWTLLDEAGREAFRAGLPLLDHDTWLRARAWAAWKALLVLEDRPGDPVATRTVRALVADAPGPRRTAG